MNGTRNNPSRRDRSKLYGSEMTARETLKHLFRTHNLSFKHRAVFDEPFTSAAGAARSKTALVFHDERGGELLFTEGEVRILVSFGLAVPPSALKTERTPVVKRGLGGLL